MFWKFILKTQILVFSLLYYGSFIYTTSTNLAQSESVTISQNVRLNQSRRWNRSRKQGPKYCFSAASLVSAWILNPTADVRTSAASLLSAWILNPTAGVRTSTAAVPLQALSLWVCACCTLAWVLFCLSQPAEPRGSCWCPPKHFRAAHWNSWNCLFY